jgi:hypothetical protein
LLACLLACLPARGLACLLACWLACLLAGELWVPPPFCVLLQAQRGHEPRVSRLLSLLSSNLAQESGFLRKHAGIFVFSGKESGFLRKHTGCQ